jgi:hypothetical protein
VRAWSNAVIYFRSTQGRVYIGCSVCVYFRVIGGDDDEDVDV